MDKDEAEKIVEAAANKLMSVVLGLIEKDPHLWSTRPCATCSAISEICGRSFGCVKKQQEAIRNGRTGIY